eukprot:gnl/TRDRNA2_/TRDRNA2_63492_c0_seq1.p1 gnl/TRDRNA2_/TRDRNA2_63492_c0~~gnl/TRDRNA2_/TRDRNA2_63492_c0_seq1.p1  ORF type:complete len:137 (+),score=32.71 gnl/TRDRNA2_/TRDRNA2_63492_c0_seq1:52-411(+)
MGDADVRLTAVTTDGADLGNVIPADAMGKEDGKKALAGKWQISGIPGKAGTVTLDVAGKSVKSEEKPFGNLPIIAEIEDKVDKLGLHVTLGGFPMKAWLKKDSKSTTLCFSNGGRWSKL